MMNPSNSDDAIRRALQILAGMTGGYNPIAQEPEPENGGHGGTGGGGNEGGSGSGSSGGGRGAIGAAAQQAANNFTGGGGSGSNSGSSGSPFSGMPPQLEALMNLMLQRMRYQEPLFRSVTQQALLGLPTYAQMRDAPIS